MFKLLVLILLTTFSAASLITLPDGINAKESITHYYIDKTNKETIFTVQNKNFKKKYHPNFGHSKNNIWLKFEIQSSQKQNYILNYGRYLVDYLDVFYVKDGKIIQEYHTGNRRKSSTKALNCNYFIFPFSLEKDEIIDIYFKIQSSKVINIPYSFETQEMHKKESFFSSLFLTVFFTTLFVIMFTNLVIYLISKKKIFRDYIFYLFGSILFWFTFQGLSFTLILGDYPLLNHAFFYIAVYIYFTSYTLYSINLIRIDIHNKKLYKAINFLIFKVFPLGIFIKLIFLESNNILISKMLSVIFATIALAIFLVCLAYIKYLYTSYKKSQAIKIINLIWLLKSIALIYLFINIKTTIFDFNLSLYIVQGFIIIETLLMSILLAYYLSFFEKSNKRLKVLRRKNKDLSLENYQLASHENLFNFIIHQWKQPLNILNSITFNIETKFNKNKLDKEFLSSQLNEIEKQTAYMSDTLDNFYSYLKTKKEKEEFNLYEALIEALNLLSNSLQYKKITYQINCKNKNIQTTGYKKEYIQTILILINNSIEALEKTSKEKTIKFEIFIDEEERASLSLEDNAGGIKIEPLESIFEYKISTKNEKKSGLGLYLAKNICNHMQKDIICKNSELGAKFLIVG